MSLEPHAPDSAAPEALCRKLRRTAVACCALVVGMIGMPYAAVPLYDLFCRLTGFDGTPIVRASGAGPAEALDRKVSVLFDANVAPGLNWRFTAEAPQVEVKVGETTTVLYRVTNTGPAPTTGVASYNVQPSLAGAYFVKIQCFCFTEQTIQPGETLESAVIFYVDPAMASDPNVQDLKAITLSYTYFPARNAKTAEAITPAPAAGNTPAGHVDATSSTKQKAPPAR
jgi:cytochrome c oxidase assembly protein subunit 11